MPALSHVLLLLLSYPAIAFSIFSCGSSSTVSYGREDIVSSSFQGRDPHPKRCCCSSQHPLDGPQVFVHVLPQQGLPGMSPDFPTPEGVSQTPSPAAAPASASPFAWIGKGSGAGAGEEVWRRVMGWSQSARRAFSNPGSGQKSGEDQWAGGGRFPAGGGHFSWWLARPQLCCGPPSAQLWEGEVMGGWPHCATAKGFQAAPISG